ncbi:GGDEF domain-containing protein [Nitratiruptor tergarcus]|uniref:diguanylate cyclase n=1 Tax=Nitratiruptor tergarcus DSM 16512 TaxID=1069081 RepID=A0A1W1WRY9_9BACT|nr:GGDEF domain-containing protein [Nitratiruptor tergarcus]SMC08972.1 diguanylate cyclase (GGDEF) domain-containing protein [Nitratiruptor tergarcus DSM 16512]
MFKYYAKYFLLYLFIGIILGSLQIYVVMEPIEIFPRYLLLPLLMILLFAYFPARAEYRLQEMREMKKREEHSEKYKETIQSTQRGRLKRDALTGALSKEAFNEIIGLKIIEAKHVSSPLSLILFDIDFFKKINDTYGHIVGDQVLKELSEVVRSNLRESEYFVRWGGEEFIVLLPGTHLNGALMVAEKLRRKVEEYTFPEVEQVTCSFGVTALKNNDTIKSFIVRADEALYEAKNDGRNRVKEKV